MEGATTVTQFCSSMMLSIKTKAPGLTNKVPKTSFHVGTRDKMLSDCAFDFCFV